jgi:hypothetical protein
MTSDPERRKFRFGLRGLFFLTLVVAGWLAYARYITHDLRSSQQQIQQEMLKLRERTQNKQSP